ncbi:hypothetical protein [Tropicimonas sp. S265A]|uniref:hypothetical protein n=1 Tax=Tropicimonas sp. S265A TaxID=3415134 RepID=UPI003C7AB029
MKWAPVLVTAIFFVTGSTSVGAASEFVAANKQRVVPASIEGAQMEVFSTAGAAGPQYFCAAGDYAVRRLEAGNSDRLVVVKGEAPSESRPRFRSVFFSVVPWQGERGGNSSINVQVDRPGEEMSVVVARKFCPPRFKRRF